MKRRECLALLVLAEAYPLSCNIINLGETFTLSTQDILKNAKNLGTFEGANLYSYNSNDRNALLLTKGLDKKTFYNNFSGIDSLEFGESSFKYQGKIIYGVKRGFKTNK